MVQRLAHLDKEYAKKKQDKPGWPAPSAFANEIRRFRTNATPRKKK